jgi:hypothetical protein
MCGASLLNLLREQHLLPNFNECWWDRWLLDVLICNNIGIVAGAASRLVPTAPPVACLLYHSFQPEYRSFAASSRRHAHRSLLQSQKVQLAWPESAAISHC